MRVVSPLPPPRPRAVTRPAAVAPPSDEAPLVTSPPWAAACSSASISAHTCKYGLRYHEACVRRPPCVRRVPAASKNRRIGVVSLAVGLDVVRRKDGTRSAHRAPGAILGALVALLHVLSLCRPAPWLAGTCVSAVRRHIDASDGWIGSPVSRRTLCLRLTPFRIESLQRLTRPRDVINDSIRLGDGKVRRERPALAQRAGRHGAAAAAGRRQTAHTAAAASAACSASVVTA